MGALAGIIYPEVTPVAYAVGPALSALQARDGGDPFTYTHKNIELGCRGSNVAFSRRNTLVAMVDGKLDNHNELVTQLKAAGCPLQNPSTSELILHAYDVWGIDFLPKLSGGFALAILDVDNGHILLARDRLGIKPLYWALYNNNFVFASELKAILATGLIPQLPSHDGIAAYLFLGYIPQDLSPIEHVNKLLPASYLMTGARHPLDVRPYWSYTPCFRESCPTTKNVSEELEHRLDRALKSQSGNHHPSSFVATSSLGSAYLASHLPDATPAMVDWPQRAPEERTIRDGVNEALHLTPRATSMTPDHYLEAAARVIWHLDEPMASPLPMALWRLCQVERENSKILINDVGSLEILGIHRTPYRGEERRPGHRRSLLAPLFLFLNREWRFELLRHSSSLPWLNAYVASRALFPSETLHLLSPRMARLFDPEIFFRRFYAASRLEPDQGATFYLDLKTSLSDRAILMCDRICGAAGLQWFSPFLDNDLVSYAACLSDAEKSPANLSDHPLHSLIDPRIKDFNYTLPSLQRPDALNPWFGDAGIQRISETLLNGTLVEAGWLSRKYLLHLFHSKNKASFLQFSSLLHLELWFRLFINEPISLSPPELSTASLLHA